MVPLGVLYPLVEDHTYQCCWCNTCSVAPAPCVEEGRRGPTVGETEIVLLEIEGGGVQQDLIPYVGQLKLANNPVKGWIIDPDFHGLLYGASDVIVQTYVMTRGDTTDGGRVPEVFLKPFPKSFCRFPYVSLIAFRLVTHIP